MAYILGLILILGIIFSAATGLDFVDNWWDNVVGKLRSFAFPKSQKEIVIDNLNSHYNLLDKFFSDTALDLLQDENISIENKKNIRDAVKSFKSSKDLVSQVESLSKKDRGLTKALIEKVLNLDTEAGPEPTYIPPNCNLICSEN